VCGAPFTTADARTVCCGAVCGQVLAKLRSDVTRSANAQARLARRCENCGEPFKARNPSGKARAGKSREGRYCSIACHGAALRHAVQLDLFREARP
jgi:predicted amidophosphoribosyltransferase